jgi:hypothetical protein
VIPVRRWEGSHGEAIHNWGRASALVEGESSKQITHWGVVINTAYAICLRLLVVKGKGAGSRDEL